MGEHAELLHSLKLPDNTFYDEAHRLLLEASCFTQYLIKKTMADPSLATGRELAK